MRILHTSDWHLGHKLYDRSRVDEHQQFLNWLQETIQREQIDMLLVSGDVFDTALPSATVTDIYYQFLHRLYTETDVITLITAGNHDSGVRLAASREFLKLGRAHVVGKLPQPVEGCIVAVDSVAVAAVPYLPEGEILSYVSFENQVDTATRYREAVQRVYQTCVEAMPADTYKILMGHLFLQGGSASNSERTIQIGGSLPVRASDIPEAADYVALGHFHRPQEIHHENIAIRYSGSALPMTFREAEHAKRVIRIDTESREIREIEIPRFRELKRIMGTFDEVMTEAHSGDWQDQYLEVHVRLTDVVAGAGDAIRHAFGERGGDVLVVEAESGAATEQSRISADELVTRSPSDIFEAYYHTRFPEGEDLPGLMVTFEELLGLLDSTS